MNIKLYFYEISYQLGNNPQKPFQSTELVTSSTMGTHLTVSAHFYVPPNATRSRCSPLPAAPSLPL
ncbi:hypothetical protein EDC91_1181 [Shewanella fodinae]|uniref:Uncharacterized protein n=1 Tax=Shewanella fodinae TaxID=552357 RepID=A0A4R2FBY4_9GAMM|nr:hypothetical protein EDC91_1181 [Shewanella fodinae]